MSREKLSTDVNFPLTDLNLSPYVSADRPPDAPGPSSVPIYDLVGVANHSGTLHGGHYVAHVNTMLAGSGGDDGGRWICFNDARITQVNSSTISGPSAYVLFYKLREDFESSFVSL